MDIKSAALNAATNPQGGAQVRVTTEAHTMEHPDAAHFRQSMERQHSMNTPPGAPREPSLGQVIATRASGLAGELKKDQQYVSRMLEKATTSGDSMQLMRAMLALNDYQLRVQTVSKVVSKASSSVDSLTKLQ
jgi:hypothetical protein